MVQSRNIHHPGRSVVMSSQGMIATSHPLSTQAGLDILKQGGNALDAAIAANAVQCVVEPFSTGLGGDCFLMYHRASDQSLHALNGSGGAPGAATPEAYFERGLKSIPERGILSVNVPGAVKAWQVAIERFGSKSLHELFQAAIAYAEKGYPVAPVVAEVWQQQQAILGAQKLDSHPLLIDGRAPGCGEIHRQPELARSLRLVAEQGAEVFYQGEIAQSLVTFSDDLNGLLSLDDLARYEPQWVEPIHSQYRGMDIYEVPPNSQGLTALITLNILQQESIGDLPAHSAEHIHWLIEAHKLAVNERDAYVSDPDFNRLPVHDLLADDFSRYLHGQISADQARPFKSGSLLSKHKDTAYLSVVDRDGNAASFINSLYYPFGSGLVEPNSGISLHNRAAGFNLQQHHVNCIAPGKRPMHTIIPAMAYQDKQLKLCFGVMGGSYQAMGHSYVLSNLLDFGLNIQQAIDAPRFLPENGVVQIEQSLGLVLREQLTRKGHQLQVSDAPLGGAQAVYIDSTKGVLHGASDGRKDGCALGY